LAEISNRKILVISGKTIDVPTSADFIEGSNISIGHLGIVAGAFDTLGIAGVIDRAIPKTRHHHLTHGDIVKAMVLNGLGFVERRLYLYPEFFSDIAVDRLLGDGVTNDHLNDDVLSRTLDAIAAYGPTELSTRSSRSASSSASTVRTASMSIPQRSASAASTMPTSTPAT
jgi:transposase